MIKREKQDFKSRNDSCQRETGEKYDLLNLFFASQYNSRPDTVDSDKKRKASKFGLEFLDSVESRCCKATWGCEVDSVTNTK